MHLTALLTESRRWTAEGLLVIGFAALTALSAQIEIPLYPVPITMQTAAVLAAGVFAGARAGALSQLTYLVGGVWLPIYAGGASGLHHLFGPTGGYLLSFPIAAAVAGWLSVYVRSVGAKFVMVFLASLVTFAIGAVWLKAALKLSWEQALMQGVYPFLVGDALKCAIVATASWGWERWQSQQA
ncbi:MAG: biotin transporter BioY [Chloroherpetonaceae bacterium]|nr:biotin transporter BioY [Chloroherpetonaceae bacterium]